MTVSRSIHASTNDPISFLFMAEQYSIVYMYHVFFIHSSVDGHLGCFPVLAIVNRAAMNTGVHVSFWIMVFSGYMPSSGIAGSHGNSIFSFFEEPKELPYVLHSGSISLHSHQQCKRVPYIWLCKFNCILTKIKSSVLLFNYPFFKWSIVLCVRRMLCWTM